MQLELHNNVQFIYELVLAQMELGRLAAEWEVSGSLREFTVPDDTDPEPLLRRSAYVKSVDGRLSDYHFIQQCNQTRSVNQYLTHWFYPYKGKFHPQMIRALMGIIGLGPGETVLDPFIGSGTTVLEAQLLGIDSIGVDVSPLCCLISRVKTGAWLVLGDIEEAAEYVAPCSESDVEQPELPEGPVRDFFDLAEMIARSDNSRRRKDMRDSFVVNRDKMLASVHDHARAKAELGLTFGQVDVRNGDARDLPVETASVDGIVTSPPYSIALNYVKNDEHALTAMGFDLDEISEEFIGVRGTGKRRFELYERDMRIAAREMHRTLKPGRQCAVVIGNMTYQGEEIDTTGMFVKACEEAGMVLEQSLDKIIFGLYNVMQKEYILIFRKPETAS